MTLEPPGPSFSIKTFITGSTKVIRASSIQVSVVRSRFRLWIYRFMSLAADKLPIPGDSLLLQYGVNTFQNVLGDGFLLRKISNHRS